MSGSSLRRVQELPKDCYHVQFVSKSAGWCSIGNSIFQSGDGGQTWRPLAVPEDELKHGFSDNLWQFQLMTPGHGWVRNSRAHFWTRDGGRSWRSFRLP